MKVLVLMGGPRKDGVVADIVHQMSKTLQDKGAEVNVVHLTEQNIRPCRGCYVCRSTGRCVIEDDVAGIHEKLDRADLLIVGYPTYWANMPGPLKTFADRSVFKFESFEGLRVKKLLKGKTAVLITACAAPFPLSLFSTDPSIRSMRRILRSGGIKVRGKIVQAGTYKREGASPRTMRRAQRLANRL